MKLPLHSDYLLSVPSCNSSPKPATMADKEEQRDAAMLWKNKPCRMDNTATKQEGAYWLLIAVVVIKT